MGKSLRAFSIGGDYKLFFYITTPGSGDVAITENFYCFETPFLIESISSLKIIFRID